MATRDQNLRLRSTLTRRSVLAALLGFAGSMAGSGSGSAASSPEFLVIVNAKNPAASVSREFLADAFLKKVTSWEHDEKVRAVDQRTRAAVRAAFSRHVLKRSVAAVRQYWLQRIFAGRDVPPPELGSDTLVVEFVATHPGAVGYVSPGTPLQGVKVIAIR